MIKISIRKNIGKKKYLLYAILSFVALIAIWTLVTELELVDPIFLPKPMRVLEYYQAAISDGSLWENTRISLYRILLGFIYAVVLGIPVGILMETLRMMIGWAWTYLVSAELVAANSGLGYTILKSQRFLATDAIFGGILLIGLLGLITDRIFAFVNKKLFHWVEGGR